MVIVQYFVLSQRAQSHLCPFSTWRQNHPTIPAWADAAHIVFSMSCNSAASECVFSLVECMFGKDQMSAMADQLQAGVMLRYNKRALG